MLQLPKERFVLQWHITHLCNLRCSHCYQEDYQSHMTRERLFSILDKFDRFVSANNYIGQINLTGGEPLLHPDFLPLAEEIRNRGFKLGILTNGTLITEKTARLLEKLQPVFVQISLDGSRKTHDAIRGKHAFKDALRGIKYLKQNQLRVLVSFTAQKHNYRDFPRLARICKRYHVDKLWWDRVVTDSDESKKNLALSTNQFQWLVEKTGKLSRKGESSKFPSMITCQRALQFLGHTDSDCSYYCSAGKNLLAVLADGDVMACRRLPFIVGNILESDFETIIRSNESLKELRSFSVPTECRDCKHLARCKGGSRCVTYAQTGDLFTKDINCYFR